MDKPRPAVGDWMYTGPRATAAHWSVSHLLGGRRFSLCNLALEFGTGSQAEYEHAASLKKCSNCIRLGAPSEQ